MVQVWGKDGGYGVGVFEGPELDRNPGQDAGTSDQRYRAKQEGQQTRFVCDIHLVGCLRCASSAKKSGNLKASWRSPGRVRLRVMLGWEQEWDN